MLLGSAQVVVVVVGEDRRQRILVWRELRVFRNIWRKRLPPALVWFENEMNIHGNFLFCDCLSKLLDGYTRDCISIDFFGRQSPGWLLHNHVRGLYAVRC